MREIRSMIVKTNIKLALVYWGTLLRDSQIDECTIKFVISSSFIIVIVRMTTLENLW